MKIKGTLSILFVFIFVSTAISQTKVQKLYEAKKYKKCITLCNKNIKENVEKLPSVLYKSLVLTEAPEDEDVLKLYPFPIYEALKGIKKLESHKTKKPKDKFYSGNNRRIKLVVKNALTKADTFFNKGDIKRSSKIYKKLMEIYPDEKLFVFKIAKIYDFNTSVVLTKIPRFSEEKYYEDIYEVASKSSKYLKKDGKHELENILEKILLQEKCDLEIASTLLVFFMKNYPSSKKKLELSGKFQNKYWQIDMLVKVNEKRVSGYICGEKQIKAKPLLVLDNCLLRATQKYAELINKESHFSHTGPDGKSPWARASDEGCYSDGENIALGSIRVSGALGQWLNSPGHCKNIMGYHTHMGIGESGTYWVQMFR